MCSQQLPLLNQMIKWIIHWYQNFAYFHNVCSFQRLFACKSHMCWLDAINLGCSCKTQIILIENGVNKHNTHTTTNTFFYHHKQRCYKLNTLQNKINEAYTIIKQTTSTIQNLMLYKKRTRCKQRVKIEGKKLKGKKDNYYNTNTPFSI